MVYPSPPFPPPHVSEIPMPWMLKLFTWKSFPQLIKLAASGKDFVSGAARKDVVWMNAGLPRPKEDTRGTIIRLGMLRPHPPPLPPLPPLLQSPQSTSTSRISPPWAEPLRYPPDPENLLWEWWRKYSSCNHLFLQWGFLIWEVCFNVFFPWFVPCTSSLTKWMNHSSSHQTSYWNSNHQNHCPHWLLCHWKFHQHRSSIQSKLPLEMSPQAHPCIQCGQNSRYQGNHWMESPHRYSLLPLRESANLMVLSLGQQQVILEIPWLCKWNPKIDWISNTVSILKSPSSPPSDHIPQWYLLCWLGLDVNQRISNRLHKQKAWLKGELINKTTISTQVAQAAQVTEPLIPEWCRDFANVI